MSYAKFTELKIAAVYGGVSSKTQSNIITAGLDILIATPGRLLDHLYNGVMTLDALETLVLDEADRMLDMGFQDEINRVLKQLPKVRQTLLFSATFDDSIYK